MKGGFHMKKEFTAPELEMMSLEVADVITTSTPGDVEDGSDTD